MCCNKRKQNHQLALQQQLNLPIQPRQRGCCGSRRQQPTMAGIIAIGIGMGAERLGRKISEKRMEKKEKKTALEREAIYGTAGSSSASSAAPTAQHYHEIRKEKKHRKSEEARQEQEYSGRRRSVSEERDEAPPPKYEDVVREDARRA